MSTLSPEAATACERELAPGPSEPFDLDADDASLPVLRENLARFGDVFRIHAATRPNDGVAIFDPDAIGRVLLGNRANYVKGVGNERVRVLLGNGLIVSDGAHWARQRKMMQPAFHGQVLRGFTALLERRNDEQIARWARQVERDEPVDLTHDLSALALGIVLESIFGSDLQRLVASLGANPFDLLVEETKRDLPFAARFRALARHVVWMIETRVAEGRDEVDFLSLLLASRDAEGKPMGDRSLLDELLTLIVAGHETSAAALNWTWYLLATHADEQRRLQSVADAGSGDPFPTQVLQESMRLYPPVWLMSRRALADDVLGGFRVAAGSDVFISPYLLHRHPKLWPRPDDFVPSRFDPKEAQHHRHAWIPFATGPRLCIGAAFAMAEMTTHLERAARRFHVEYLGEGEPAAEFRINLRTRESLPVRLRLREGGTA